MRHYEVVFLVHPDQSEQVSGMIERYSQMVSESGGKELWEMYTIPVFEMLTERYAKKTNIRLPSQNTQSRYTRLIDKVDTYTRESIYEFANDELDIEVAREDKDRRRRKRGLENRDFEAERKVSGYLTGQILSTIDEQ